MLLTILVLVKKFSTSLFCYLAACHLGIMGCYYVIVISITTTTTNTNTRKSVLPSFKYWHGL